MTFTPYQPPLGCNWWGMANSTAVGDVLPHLTSANLHDSFRVKAALEKYDKSKGTKLWWFSPSDGIMKRVEWDKDKILQFSRSRRQAEGNPRFALRAGVWKQCNDGEDSQH